MGCDCNSETRLSLTSQICASNFHGILSTWQIICSKKSLYLCGRVYRANHSGRNFPSRSIPRYSGFWYWKPPLFTKLKFCERLQLKTLKSKLQTFGNRSACSCSQIYRRLPVWFADYYITFNLQTFGNVCIPKYERTGKPPPVRRLSYRLLVCEHLGMVSFPNLGGGVIQALIIPRLVWGSYRKDVT